MSMIETILMVLAAFALPIPPWLILLHSTIIKSKGVLRKIIYFSLSLLWSVSFITVFNLKDYILAPKFTPGLFLKIVAIIILFIALIIDFFTVRALGYRRLACVAELQKKQTPGTLITKGIYNYARHPRYVEYLLLSLFFTLFLGYYSFLFFTIYLLIGLVIATEFEEKELINRFGNSYIEYKNKVPKFFIRFK